LQGGSSRRRGASPLRSGGRHSLPKEKISQYLILSCN
jgi:hypothetical protein